MQQHMLPNNTETPDEIIRSLCRREGDTQERNFWKYRDTVRDVWLELNLASIRFTQRQLIEVDKRTNSIQLPKNFLLLSSVSYIDDCNNIVPVAINKNIHDDIVDISLDKDCTCECKCKSDLCGTIKNYEAIVEDVVMKLPDNSFKTFSSISRKLVYPDGSLFLEKTYPIKKYANGVFTSVELTTETELLCALEVESCGCIKDTSDNRKKLGDCCNAATYTWDWGCSCCDIPLDPTYNFSELGDRLIFPSTCAFDKALVRFYVESSIKDMRIPRVAKDAFMAGIKVKASEYDDKVAEYLVRRYITSYNQKKELLSVALNKYTLHEFYSTILPKRRMV